MYKLLLVDDERIIREGISSIVDWNGIGISLIGTAKNGIEACEAISANLPDIVLTDIKMPGMDGLELDRKIRDEYPETTVVILSGYGEFELARKAIDYGVKHYVLKPCDKDEIVAVMKNTLSEIERRKRKEEQKVYCDTFGGNYKSNNMKYSVAVKKVIKYIEENLSDEKLCLVSISNDILYMNTDYLGKLFKKETGEKFSQYVIKARIEKAKVLIKGEVGYKTFEIAEKTGFGNNPQYFSQVFKKYTGYTPSEYKQFV